MKELLILRKEAKKLIKAEHKNIPEAQQWKCKRCGKMSCNRINCPDCLTFLTDKCSMENQSFIFNCSWGEDIGIKNPHQV